LNDVSGIIYFETDVDEPVAFVEESGVYVLEEGVESSFWVPSLIFVSGATFEPSKFVTEVSHLESRKGA
jgi:hypothetical protein